MSPPSVVVASAVRLPIGRFRGALKDIHTIELGSTVARAAIARACIAASDVDEIIVSETYRGDLPGCSARPIGLKAGLPIETTGLNLNMHCGSGLRALVHAAQTIRVATGGILAVKALHELRRTGGGAALLTMCIGGGQGIAVAVDVDV